jgi:hypothetical protein
MVTSFDILLTNFPFCNNPEENINLLLSQAIFAKMQKRKYSFQPYSFLAGTASWNLSSISRKPLVARSLKVSTELVIANFTESLSQWFLPTFQNIANWIV